jgi:hypothetical protein
MPIETPYNISRNGVSKALSLFVGKRDTWKDKPYQAPQVTDETFDTDIVWVGKANVKNFLNTILRRISQDYLEDATDEKTGIFNEDQFITYMQDFAAAGLKLAELKELYYDEVAKMTTYIGSEEFTEELMSGHPSRIEAARAKANTMKTAINGLKAEMDARSNRRSKEKETETVSPS